MTTRRLVLSVAYCDRIKRLPLYYIWKTTIWPVQLKMLFSQSKWHPLTVIALSPSQSNSINRMNDNNSQLNCILYIRYGDLGIDYINRIITLSVITLSSIIFLVIRSVKCFSMGKNVLEHTHALKMLVRA
jgi:hypothetical protein